VLRSGTRRGQDVPGDELAVISGFPLRRAPADVALSAGVCPSPPPPAPRPSGPADGPADGAVFLPAMADLGYNGRCQATLTATNSGAAPARAVAVVYGKPWFASPGCSGPTSVLCSGLLAPGETWQLGPDPSLADSFSAVVYGFNTRTLADLGLPGGDEAVADWLCRAGGLVGDCAAARQFQLAYSFGGVFKGIPMDRAYAAPIQASVTRQCPDAVQPTATNTSCYVGASGAAFDLTRPTAGGYHDSVATVKADADGLNTILYLQTAGLGTATIHIVFRPLGELAGGKQCFVFTLAPGEAFPWDSSDCIGPGFTGTAFITSTEPLAVMGETLGAGVQRTWLSHPTWNAYDLNDDGVVNLADEAVVAGALGAAPGNVRWNARTDFDHDLTVTDADRALFNLGGLGHPMPTPTSTPTHTAAPPSPPALYMPYANQPRP
jgi:hypothetical protein